MTTSQLCPHKLNPRTCLTCFNAPKPRQAAAPQPSDPRQHLQDNPLGAPLASLPGTKPPPVVGDRSGAQIGVRAVSCPQATPEERAKHRGESLGGLKQQVVPVQMREPYSVEQHDGTEFDPNRLWEPPVRPQLIDQLPSPPPPVK